VKSTIFRDLIIVVYICWTILLVELLDSKDFRAFSDSVLIISVLLSVIESAYIGTLLIGWNLAINIKDSVGNILILDASFVLYGKTHSNIVFGCIGL